MVKITILYPATPGSRFDMDYYLGTHMPMSIDRLSGAQGFRGVTVSRGVGAGLPDSKPPYTAVCDFVFDSLEDFLAAFTTHAETLQGDIPNYTDVEPLIQVSEVEILR
jgi:uncharacterized protein (TIGR02118 family)